MVQSFIAAALDIQKNKVDVKVGQNSPFLINIHFDLSKFQQSIMDKLNNSEELLLFLLQIMGNLNNGKIRATVLIILKH
jgi:hypothetical protein